MKIIALANEEKGGKKFSINIVFKCTNEFNIFIDPGRVYQFILDCWAITSLEEERL